MRLPFAASILALGLAAGLPALVLAADKKPAEDAKKDVDADKLAPGEFTGKLKTPPGSDGSFTLEVQYDHVELKDPNALARVENQQMQQAAKQQQELAKLQGQLATARNPGEYLRRMQQMTNEINKLQAQAIQQGFKPQNSPFKMVVEKKDVDFHTADGVKVRALTLPIKFDDKGDIKKYTEDEKKQLRGKDASLPGYEAKLEDLKTGQFIKVTLARHKEDKKDADKDKDAKDKDAKETTHKLEVTLIVIGEDGADAGKPTDGKKK
jgi:hypothetical protein